MVSYTVRHWPHTMPFDPWTSFPYGTSVGQFGTLYDQLVATAALVVGLGSPTSHQVAMTLLFAPAVFGTLVALPVFAMGRRLGGTFAGLLSVLILALTPGAFLRRSVVGFADHHVVEALFMALGLLTLMVALTAAEEDRPIFELFRSREWDVLKRPIFWSVLTGVIVTLYIYVWPPGIFLVGILGFFFAIRLSADYVRGVSPDHVATIGAVSMGTTGVLTLLSLQQLSPTATKISIAHPLIALAVAAGCVFMAWLAREWNARDLPKYNYPIAIVALGVVLTGLAAVVTPDIFSFLVSQFLRVFGHSASDTAQTVGEAQSIPFSRAGSFLLESYGLAYFAAVIGAALGVWRLASGKETRGQVLLMVVVLVFMTAATLTQRRFDYYLILPVTALTAYIAGYVLDLTDLRSVSRLKNIESYQVMTVIAIFLVITGPFVVFAGPTLASVQTADRSSYPGSVTQWNPTLQWMSENTPEEGTYGIGSSAEAMEYYGTYEETNDFSYPDGAYGVMSWWDYGHWITVLGHRIPNANPFQQGSTNAANYLLAPNETQANELITYSNGSEETRYVMIDWKLAVPFSLKYTAPTAFDTKWGLTSNELITPIYTQQGRLSMVSRTQRHYESMRVRLYHAHGSSMEPAPIVVDYQRPQMTNSEVQYAFAPSSGRTVRVFDNMTAAREFVQRDGTARIGGIGRFPSERVPALEHYRLVKQSQSSAQSSRRYIQIYRSEATKLAQALYNTNRPNANQTDRAFRLLTKTRPAWVKSFERVPGATVRGTGPANANVTASVRMFVPSTQSTFTYTQRIQTGPDGEFTTTLPYSTTGYDKWGTEEGYTNVSVRAMGPYRFSTPRRVNESLYTTRWTAQAHVSEGQVIGENDTVVTVDMNKRVLNAPEGAQANNTNTANGSGNTTDTSGGGNTTTSGSLAGPTVDGASALAAEPRRT